MMGCELPIIIDVREETGYNAGHIPGVLHISGNKVVSIISEIPKDRFFVTD